MPRRSKRYYSEDDFEIGVTPSQLKRLAKAKQLEYIMWWFERMFEDPSNQTPYNSEDGFTYPWGGPYDAADELNDEFGNLVSEEVIDNAVANAESVALEWAPGTDHPDHDRAARDYEESQRDEEGREYEIGFDLDEIEARLDQGLRPQYGDDWERRRRLQILRDVEELEFELPKNDGHGGIGHNRPPSDMQMSPEETAGIRNAAAKIREELTKAEPDAKKVVRSTKFLKAAYDAVAKRIGMAADEFAKNFGKTAGIAGAGAVIAEISGYRDDAVALLGNIIQSLGEWLHTVTLPF